MMSSATRGGDGVACVLFRSDAWRLAPRSYAGPIGAAVSCCAAFSSPCKPRSAFLFTSRSFVLEQGYGSQKGAPGELLPTGVAYRRAARCPRLATGCSFTGGASVHFSCRHISMSGGRSRRRCSWKITSTTFEVRLHDVLGLPSAAATTKQ